jgi:hypothetical protein
VFTLASQDILNFGCKGLIQTLKNEFYVDTQTRQAHLRLRYVYLLLDQRLSRLYFLLKGKQTFWANVAKAK